jgi:Mg-chelatase subunit ChlD
VQVVSEKQAVAMISFYPDVNDEEVYSEIVFVVDRSGSMAGDKMKRGMITDDVTLMINLLYNSQRDPRLVLAITS